MESVPPPADAGAPPPGPPRAPAATPNPPTIVVDADGCPVKDEVYRVARRFGAHVILVGNTWIGGPPQPWLERVVVGRGLDAADDWIAERAAPDTIVVTADIPLAARCVAAGARVVSPRGRVFTDANVGDALATRDLLQGLREGGLTTGGPAPFAPRDRSLFLQRLDELVRAAGRGLGGG